MSEAWRLSSQGNSQYSHNGPVPGTPHGNPFIAQAPGATQEAKRTFHAAGMEDDGPDQTPTPVRVQATGATDGEGPISQPVFHPNKIQATERQIRSRSASQAPREPTGDSRMHTEEEEVAPPTEDMSPEEAKAKELADFIAMMKQPDQAADEGSVSFPRYTHPRSAHTKGHWSPYLRFKDVAGRLMDARKTEQPIVWVQCYKTKELTSKEEALFKWALRSIEANGLVKDFKVSEYTMLTVPDKSSAMVVIANSKEAGQRLLSNRVITARSPAKSGTFWLHADNSWGTHIIVDITGGGNDFVKDVLPRFWKTFGPVISRAKGKTDKATHVDLLDLAYYKVPMSDKMHKGSNVVRWRVRFKYEHVCTTQEWVLPRTIGYSNRGMIGVHKAPFCSHCISDSHAQTVCEWWKENLVAGAKVTPQNYVKAEWIKIPSVDPRKLASLLRE